VLLPGGMQVTLSKGRYTSNELYYVYGGEARQYQTNLRTYCTTWLVPVKDHHHNALGVLHRRDVGNINFGYPKSYALLVRSGYYSID
jgi:hypothetical protein